MPEKQYARGIFGQFTASERPFDVPNGMEDNLRLIDDHLGLYTLAPPLLPGTFQGTSDGDGQIYTDGTYAVRNGGVVREYPPRKGLRAVAADGTESWLNTGNGWEQFSVLDTGPATAEALAAAERADGSAQAAAATANMRSSVPEALADGTIPNGGRFTAPLSDGSWQAYLKVSSVSATAVGAPFASSAAVIAAAKVAAHSDAALGAAYAEQSSTKGSTAPNEQTMPVGFSVGCGIPTPSIGRVPMVYVGMSAAGTGELHVYTPNSSGPPTVRKIIPVTANAAGLNAFVLDPVRYWPAGSIIHYNPLTGGRPRYAAGGLGSTVNNTSQVEGQLLAGVLNQAYANTPALAYDFVGTATVPVDMRLGSLESGSTDQQKNVAAATGVTGAETSLGTFGDTSPNDNTITPNFTYGNSYRAPSSGFLEFFSVRLNGAGTGRLIVYEPNEETGTDDVVKIFNLTATGLVNTWTDFGGYFAKKGSIFQYSRITGGYPRFVAGGAGSRVVQGDGATHIVGSQHTSAPNPNTFAIAFGLRASPAPLKDRIDALESTLTSIGRTPLSPSRSLESARFSGSTLPADWSAAAGWSVNNGLTASASGGWNNVALAGKRTSMARRRIIARIIPSDTVGIWGICSNMNPGGLAALVDGTAGKLRLYAWTGSATAGTLVAEAALPNALVAGRAYSLRVDKDGLKMAVTLVDATTLISTTVTSTATSAQLHGRAGVMQVSGAPIFVDAFDHFALYGPNVRAILNGDSNTEGTALLAGQVSWAFLLAAMRPEGDIVVTGRAGDATPNYVVDRKATDLLSFTSARYYFHAMGTNDQSHASWRVNTQTCINDAISIGAEPILCTMPPRPDRQSILTPMNDDIRNHFFGRFRFVDFAKALSLNQDSVTWNPLYDSGDHTHDKFAGHLRRVEQVLADVPDLVY
jgi:hypothetical protein